MVSRPKKVLTTIVHWFAVIAKESRNQYWNAAVSLRNLSQVAGGESDSSCFALFVDFVLCCVPIAAVNFSCIDAVQAILFSPIMTAV